MNRQSNDERKNFLCIIFLLTFWFYAYVKAYNTHIAIISKVVQKRHSLDIKTFEESDNFKSVPGMCFKIVNTVNS